MMYNIKGKRSINNLFDANLEETNIYPIIAGSLLSINCPLFGIFTATRCSLPEWKWDNKNNNYNYIRRWFYLNNWWYSLTHWVGVYSLPYTSKKSLSQMIKDGNIMMQQYTLIDIRKEMLLPRSKEASRRVGERIYSLVSTPTTTDTTTTILHYIGWLKEKERLIWVGEGESGWDRSCCSMEVELGVDVLQWNHSRVINSLRFLFLDVAKMRER